MKTTALNQTALEQAALNQPQPLLQWVLRKGADLVTCQLDEQAHAYTVSLVPHRNVQLASVEVFERGTSAFARHAALADRLRQTGWTVIAHTGSGAHPQSGHGRSVAA